MLWRFLPAHWWPRWGALVSTVAISVALLTIGDRAQFAVVRGLRSTILYPASLVDSTFRELWSIRQENDLLRRELAETRVRLDRLVELETENERLAALLEFRAATSDTLVPGRVVGRGRDAGGDWNYLSVRADLPDWKGRSLVAVTPRGLVGQVVEQSLGFALVRSLASSRSAVHVIDSRSRVAGVVRSEGGVGSLLRMDHVPAQEDVAPGDTIVTSGQGTIYPRGIPVGTVVRVDAPEDALIKRVWVDPFVRFARLEEVALMPGQGEEEG
jgi:rod shape-determining protein MreC